jgi:nucleoside-diphosphate-sugar epimerase
VNTALVTGGAGFIGAHLVKRLARDGWRIAVLDDLSWGDPRTIEGLDGVELIRADVANINHYQDILGGVSHVFHLAALISAYQSLEQPDAYLETNVTGLLRVLETCSHLSRPRVVFASTSGVYGNSPHAVKRESDPPMPTTVYALTKLAGEHLLHMYRDRFGYDDVSLRLFNVYGPGQNPEHPYANVTCQFARAAAIQAPVQLIGDGAQTRDFIYIDDVIDAFVIAATRPCQHRVYNVGGGSPSSILRLLRQAEELSGCSLEVVRRPAWPNDIRAISADCSRLRDEHGFAPQVSLRDGLARTIDAFRQPA